MWNPGVPSKCMKGKKMFEIDSMIFSIPNPGCWLWMAVVENSVSFCAEITTIIVICFSKLLAQKYIVVGLRLLLKYMLEVPNLIYVKELGLLSLLSEGEKVSPLFLPHPLQC